VPEVVPPRPSAPGYAEFIAHGQPKPETPNETRAAQPPPATSAAQARMPQDNLSQDSNVVNGGLYYAHQYAFVRGEDALANDGRCILMTALNNLDEQIREYYQQAVDCARQADGQNDPKVKQQFLELKRLWLLLAQRCKFNKT
jgi:hypothetical protein